jgi:hypothetical protein
MNKVVMLKHLEDAAFIEEPSLMRFRLTYEGDLKASQKDPINGQIDKMAEHKHGIRREFHEQLKHLWNTNKFLREYRKDPDSSITLTPAEQLSVWGGGVDKKIPYSEWVANNYREHGYRFAPLVREEISLLCSLDILFLRRDIPGSVVSAGDLDNRIKTLIDTLRRPRNGRELRGNENPAPGEDPFYCLLEDDKLVTHLTVETDTLLDPPTGNTEADQRQVKLIITVDLKPYNVTMFNLSFA